MNKLLKNSLYLSFFTVLVLPASYLIRLIMTKNLSLEDYGLFFALIGFFNLVQSFNDLGFSEAQAFFVPKYLVTKKLSRVRATVELQFFNQLVTTLLMGVIIFFGANWITTHLFHAPQAVELLRIMILYFILQDFLNNIKILFFSFQEAKIYGSQEVFRICLTALLLLVGLATLQFNLFIVAWTWIIVYLILTIFYTSLFFYQHYHIFKVKRSSYLSVLKEFLPFLLPTLAANKAGTLFSALTEVLLTYFGNLTSVGLYNIAKPISNLALALTTPFASLLKPYISEVDAQQDQLTVKKIMSVILNAGVFFLLPLSLSLIFYAQESIVFLFGSQFIAASLTLKIIAIDIFFLLMNMFVFGVVFGLGLQKKRAMVIYISSILNLFLSLLLIPKWGAPGVALANLCYSMTAVLGGLYIIYQQIQFELPTRNYLKIFLLLIGFAFTQTVFKLWVPVEHGWQFVFFLIKVMLGLGLYYWLGVFWLRIIDLKFISKLLRPLTEKRIFNTKLLMMMVQKIDRYVTD